MYMHVNTRIDRIDEHGMQRIIIRDKELPSMQNYPGCACMYITLYVLCTGITRMTGIHVHVHAHVLHRLLSPIT